MTCNQWRDTLFDWSVGVRVSEQNKKNDFLVFCDSVKAKIPINELYTKLTGEEFVKNDKARWAAKIRWREDKNPSLIYVPNENMLWDFTVQNPKSKKPGWGFNVLDVLMKVGGAVNLTHALQMACEISKTELPKAFHIYKDQEYADLGINTGKKIQDIWGLCRKSMGYYLNNPDKRPASMVKFFEDRNIPFDKDFLKAINIGICPKYDETFSVLKGTSLLRKGKDGKELNIFRKDLEDNAIIFPLYNLNGALCGLRARQLDHKDFAEWMPFKTQAFYNANRFSKKPANRRILLVEGEMNLVAYARSVYERIKDTSEYIQNDIENALSIIYASGPKNSNISTFGEHGLKKVLYLQDHDINDYDDTPDPKDHPILKTCTNVSSQIAAQDLLVVDWHSLDYAKEKYDIENYLKYHNYDITSLKDLPTISFPRYAYKIVKSYIDTIQNKDSQKENQYRLIKEIGERLDPFQKKIFDEICEEEFKISDDAKNLITNNRSSKFLNFSIDSLGRIISTETDNNNQKFTKVRTNFHLRFSKEMTYYSHVKMEIEKYYNMEILINNKIVGQGQIVAEDSFKPDKVMEFCAKYGSLTDFDFCDGALMGKGFSIVVSLLRNNPVPRKEYIFSSLARPIALTQDLAAQILKTNKYCLFPNVSIVDGEVIKNDTVQINLADREAIADKTNFEFNTLNDDDFRKAGNMFWNHLRKVNKINVVESLIALAFESCTRELQGSKIVSNAHGFPIFVVGQSGSYKSTAAIAAMSLLGKFTTQSDLMSWNGTMMSIEFKLGRLGTVAHCLDDLKIEDFKSNQFVDFFHAVYGGSSRERMASSGDKLKGGGKLQCSLMITTEASMSDIPESIAARFLAIRLTKNSDEKIDRIHLDKMYEKVDDSGKMNIDLMRGFMPRMIAWAQERGQLPYTGSLIKWKDHYSEILSEHKNNVERPIDMVTRLVSAYEQITEFVKESEIALPEEVDEAFSNFVKFWDGEIKNQITRIEKQSSTSKAVDIITQLMNSTSVGIRVYRNGRWHSELQRNGPNPIIDITYPDGRRKLILTSTNVLLSAMNLYSEGGHKIVKDKLEVDLFECGLIENGTIANPKSLVKIPDFYESGKMIEMTGIVIDYDKFMKYQANSLNKE